MKKIIYLDFDGVLNNYTKWRGEDFFYEPKKGVRDFLNKLSNDFEIVVFIVRDNEQVEKWLIKYNLIKYIEKITDKKGLFYLYVDDRCIKFDGNFDNLSEAICSFKIYWQN